MCFNPHLISLIEVKIIFQERTKNKKQSKDKNTVSRQKQHKYLIKKEFIKTEEWLKHQIIKL